MIWLLIVVIVLLVGYGAYITLLYYRLGKAYMKQQKEMQKQWNIYISDLRKVVEEIQTFITKSAFLQYNPEAQRLLIFLRSFVQQLTQFIMTREKEVGLHEDDFEDEELEDDDEY